MIGSLGAEHLRAMHARRLLFRLGQPPQDIPGMVSLFAAGRGAQIGIQDFGHRALIPSQGAAARQPIHAIYISRIACQIFHI